MAPGGSRRNGCAQRASAAARRARWRKNARTPPCRTRPTPARTTGAAPRHATALNHRSSTSNDQARRNSRPHRAPQHAALPQAPDRFVQDARMLLEPTMHRQAKSGFRPIQVTRRQSRLHQAAYQNLPAAAALVHQQRGVDAQHELDQPMVEQRGSYLERMRHAGPVHLGQQSLGQVRVQIEPAQLRQRVKAPRARIADKTTDSRNRSRARTGRAHRRSAQRSFRRARRRRPAGRRTLGAASRRPIARAGGRRRASARFSRFDRAPTLDQ